MNLIRNIFNKNKNDSLVLPEVEVSDFPEEPVYIVTGSYKEFRMYCRVKKLKNAVFITDRSQLRTVKDSHIIFTGSWNLTTDGNELWEYAEARGNRVEEDFIL